jgi:hypothetical protein
MAKLKLLHFYCILYSLIAGGFCIYWALNFGEHVSYKGDEFFTLVEVLLIITYAFFLLVQFSVQRINLLFALSIPIMTCIATLLIGLVIAFVTGIGGIPREYILIYGLLYVLISVIAVYTYWVPAVKNKGIKNS